MYFNNAILLLTIIIRTFLINCDLAHAIGKREQEQYVTLCSHMIQHAQIAAQLRNAGKIAESEAHAKVGIMAQIAKFLTDDFRTLKILSSKRWRLILMMLRRTPIWLCGSLTHISKSGSHWIPCHFA